MTCHHASGDPNCSGSRNYVPPSPPEPRLPLTPDAENFEVLEIEELAPYLVLKVQYPSCQRCVFEGNKIMVIKGTIKDAVKWRRIDPHFRDDKMTQLLRKNESPSPEARFPANDQGWKDAMRYARERISPIKR